MKKTALALALCCAWGVATKASAQSTDEKLRILQQEIDELKAQVKNAPQGSAGQQTSGSAGLQGSATTISGYGEFNYNNYKSDERPTQADLRRFVFGLHHRFDDRLTFHSEVEFEHAVVSKDDEGEVELEQAWLNYKFSDAVNVKGGLFLIPLGILNETHEPPTYYGVERNEVETRIIPTTWRELGVGVHGLLGASGLRYDVGITTGFDSGKLDDPSTGVRSAHQEGQLANAHDLSVYGALNYRRSGLLVGAGLFTGNTGQNGATNPLLKGVDARLTMWDVHAQYKVGRLELQAVYADGKLADGDQLNAAILATSAEPFAAPNRMKGAYVQAAYHLYKADKLDFAPFVRLEGIDIRQQEDPANGLFQDPANHERITTAGFNFWVHPQVVLKADVQRYRTDSTKDRFDLGVGYMF
ncbi:MAG TPA: porin [Burkholderiales bacterium]|nr:porin [Burkholderiales bacterium]